MGHEENQVYRKVYGDQASNRSGAALIEAQSQAVQAAEIADKVN